MIPFGFALLLQVKGIYGNLSKGTIKFPTKPTSICWIPGYIPLVLVLAAVVGGGGGEVEFPKLVLYPEQKTFVSLKTKHVHHVFPVPGAGWEEPKHFWVDRCGDLKSLRPLAGAGWPLSSYFQMQYTSTNESHSIVTKLKIVVWSQERKQHHEWWQEENLTRVNQSPGNRAFVQYARSIDIRIGLTIDSGPSIDMWIKIHDYQLVCCEQQGTRIWSMAEPLSLGCFI